MARDPLEVLVNTGTFYVAAATPSTPEPRPTDPGTAVGGNFLEVGYTDGGWTFGRDATFEDIEVAEENDPVNTLQTAQTMTWTAALAQNSLEVLQWAMGGGTITPSTPGVGFRRYTPPATGTFTTYTLLFRTNAPPGDGSKLRDWYAPRAISQGAFEIAHAKAPQKQLVAVVFKLIKPTTGDIFDVTEDE